MPVIDAVTARGSRLGQRPLSTCARKSLTIALNMLGSSTFIPCPQFGMTTKAADGMFCYIRIPGVRQGQSSSPIMISVGTVSAFIRSTRL